MIASIVLGLLLGVFRFNFAENILKIVLTEFYADDVFEWILYSLLKIAFLFCMYDISSIAGISTELSMSAEIAIRNTFVIIVSYSAGYATNLLLKLSFSKP